MNAAPSLVAQGSLLHLTERLVTGAQDSSQIIAFALVFFWRDDFGCIVGRINKVGGAFEMLSIRLFGARVGMVWTGSH